jgi:hypothetical protein
MSRPEFTKRFYKLLEQRSLYYAEDKRVLRVDKEISNVLKIPMDVNGSIYYKDPKGFNFYNVQKYIAKCYNEDDALNETKKESEKNNIVLSYA